MAPPNLHTHSRLPNAACKPWSIPNRLPIAPPPSTTFQHKDFCLRRRCQPVRMQALPDDEPAQIAQEDENVDQEAGQKRTEAEYLGKLAKEPYAVAVLGVVALSKGVEAIAAAAKQIMKDQEKTGEANVLSGKSLTDREFWKNIGSSIKFGDAKASLQSLNKNISEWTKTLGDASDWAGDEIKEDLNDRLVSLQEWVELQRESISEVSNSLKTPKKEPGKKAPAPVKPKEQGSAFGDILNSLNTLRKKKMEERASATAARAAAVDKALEEKKDAQPTTTVSKQLGKNVAEPGSKKDSVSSTATPAQPIVEKKDDAAKVAAEAAQKALKEAKIKADEAAKAAKAKADKAAEEARVKAEEAAKEAKAKAERDAREKTIAEYKAREELVKKSVDTPKTVSSAAEVTKPPQKESTTAQQDKSVASMVDKIMADTKSAASAQRPRRNISKPRPPPSAPSSIVSTPPASKDPPGPPSSPRASLSSAASTSAKGAETSKPVISSSSSEKKGPGTASFFKTGGTSVSGGALGGVGGMSVQKQEGSKLSAGRLDVDKTITSSASPRRGILGEELGKGPMKPASYSRPNLQVEATGSGGGVNDSGDDNGSSGNGGSGDSPEESGEPSPNNYSFVWVLLLIALGGIAYKYYVDKKESEESGSSPDGQIQYSSSGK